MALSLQAGRLYRFDPLKLYLLTTNVTGSIFSPSNVEGVVLDPGALPRPSGVAPNDLASLSVGQPNPADFTEVRPRLLSPEAFSNYELAKAMASRDAAPVVRTGVRGATHPLGAKGVNENLASQGVPFLGDKPVDPNDPKEAVESFRRMVSNALGIPLENIQVEAQAPNGGIASVKPSPKASAGDDGWGHPHQGTERWNGFPFPAASFRLDDQDHGLGKNYRNSAGELCVLLEFLSGPDMGFGRAFGRRHHQGKQWRAHSWDVLHHDLRPVTGVDLKEGTIYKFPDGDFGRVPIGAKSTWIDGKLCVEVHEFRDSKWVAEPFVWIAVRDTDNRMSAASISEITHLSAAEIRGASVAKATPKSEPAIGSWWERRVTTSPGRVYKVLDVADGDVWTRYARAGGGGIKGQMKYPLKTFLAHFKKAPI